jgi:glycosyltransferase involved in cell wall biosynthesis
VIVELTAPIIAKRGASVEAGVELRWADLGLTPKQLGQLGAGPWYRFLRTLGADVGVLAKAWPEVGSPGLDLACRVAFRGRFLTIEHCTPSPRASKISRRHLGFVPGLGLWWYAQGLPLYLRSLFPRRIVTVSRAIADELIQHYGFPTAKVVPIPNGVDGERFAPDPAARARTRATWNVPADAVVFGSVGRLKIRDKGIDVAIEAFARLCAANPDRPLWCVLVGSGSDEATLKAQARDSGWGHRILFPGVTDRPWEAYCGLDVFLMPSRFEGIGLSLLEAMACGCCPVVMGVGGIKEVVSDATLGWLAPPADHEAFVRGMQAALDAGPDGRAAMGARTRAHVLGRFRAEDQYGKLAEVIEQL